MKVNVVITPKKNELIECDGIHDNCDGTITLVKTSGRGKSIKHTPVAGFKKWIRYYVLPEIKGVKK